MLYKLFKETKEELVVFTSLSKDIITMMPRLDKIITK